MLNKNTEIISKVSVAFVLMLSAIDIQASECGVIQFISAKSSGVVIQNNQCADKKGVSQGTDFVLNSGARLWLKASSNEGSTSNYQVICQNKSSTDPIKMNVSSKSLPWINPKSLDNCTGWVSNKLACDDAQGNRNQLFCMIAEIKEPNFNGSKKFERTTSVKMRGIEMGAVASQVDVKQVIAAIKPEIEICRSLYEVRKPINVKWLVTPAAKATAIAVQQVGNGQDFSECVKTVISDFAYPEMNNLTVIHTF